MDGEYKASNLLTYFLIIFEQMITARQRCQSYIDHNYIYKKRVNT